MLLVLDGQCVPCNAIRKGAASTAIFWNGRRIMDFVSEAGFKRWIES